MQKTLLAFFFLTSLTAAQSWQLSFVSPRGAEFFDGSSTSNIMLGNFNPSTRVQQIDNNLVGQNLTLVRFIGWRRDKSGGGSGAVAKKTTLTVLMSHADFAQITNTWATNYKDGPKTVFQRKSVSLPDWRTAASPPPAEFDVILPLDQPFVYNRQDALLWDVLNEQNPATAYAQDWHGSATIPHTYGDYPTDLRGGCQTTNGPMRHEVGFRANATAMELCYKVHNAPGGGAVLGLLGASDPQLTFPGLCGTLHAQPLILVNLGTADAQGTIPLLVPITGTWSPVFVGAVLFSQAVAADPTQPGFPLALSNGLRVPAPAANSSAPILVKRIYHTSSTTSTTGTGPSDSACPTIYAF